MRKGSITIFSLLSMILVASCLCCLLEGARFHEIKRMSQLQTDLALEGIFANYSSALWEEYHLLACNREGVEEKLITYGNARYSPEEYRVNLLQFQVDSSSVEGYTLLTDEKGYAYMQAVSAYMEKNLLYETAMQIYNQYESIKQIQENSEVDLSLVQKALDIIENEKAQDVSRSSTRNQDVEKKENPLAEIKQIMEKGILELVIEDTSGISQSEGIFGITQRELNTGKNAVIRERQWIDKIYLQQYLLLYMSNYLEPQENGILSYEMEYLIGNSSKDMENLKMVVTQLLGIRSSINFLYLLTDVEKLEEAKILAVALAGMSGNPVVVEAVKLGVLTAWAIAESILDVRALLSGKRIALLKNDTLWTLELTQIGAISEGYFMAKECATGLSYKDYLGMLLLFQQEQDIAVRAMNIQEAVIQRKYELPEFCMDDFMINTEVKVTYLYRRIFPIIGMDGILSKLQNKIETRTNYEY